MFVTKKTHNRLVNRHNDIVTDYHKLKHKTMCLTQDCTTLREIVAQFKRDIKATQNELADSDSAFFNLQKKYDALQEEHAKYVRERGSKGRFVKKAG